MMFECELCMWMGESRQSLAIHISRNHGETTTKKSSLDLLYERFYKLQREQEQITIKDKNGDDDQNVVNNSDRNDSRQAETNENQTGKEISNKSVERDGCSDDENIETNSAGNQDYVDDDDDDDESDTQEIHFSLTTGEQITDKLGANMEQAKTQKYDRNDDEQCVGEETMLIGNNGKKRERLKRDKNLLVVEKKTERTMRGKQGKRKIPLKRSKVKKKETKTCEEVKKETTIESEMNHWRILELPRPCDYCYIETEDGKLMTKGLFRQWVHDKCHSGHVCLECTKCGVVFTDIEQCTDHFESFHSIKDSTDFSARKITCKICPMICRSTESLRLHRMRLHGKTLRCPVCNAEFDSKMELRRHKLEHSGKTIYQCSACPKTFTAELNLKEHEKFHEKSEDLRCNCCNRYFSSKKSKKKHEDLQMENKTYRCTECNCVCPSSKAYKTHYQRYHDTSLQFPCAKCSKRFATAEKLKNHKCSSTDPVTCAECGQVLPNEMSLFEHTRNLHDFARPFVCTVCSKRFKSRQYLRKHMLFSHKQPHLHELAKLRKRQQASLERNKIGKPKQKSLFICSTCGKQFAYKKSLQGHETLHIDGYDLPKCHICNKTFHLKNNLLRHMNSHSDEKPFICSLCGKGFHQKVNLQQHERSHSNIRPYPCNLCNKRFNQKSNLKQHMLKNHQNYIPVNGLPAPRYGWSNEVNTVNNPKYI